MLRLYNKYMIGFGFGYIGLLLAVESGKQNSKLSLYINYSWASELQQRRNNVLKGPSEDLASANQIELSSNQKNVSFPDGLLKLYVASASHTIASSTRLGEKAFVSQSLPASSNDQYVEVFNKFGVWLHANLYSRTWFSHKKEGSQYTSIALLVDFPNTANT